MKQGRSLVELAQELERQAASKRDFVADTRKVMVRPSQTVREVAGEAVPSVLDLIISGMDAGEIFPVNPHALRQMGSKLDIPAKYVDRLAMNHPDLLAHNINQLFEREPKARMIRTLDGNVRAFMSDRFRPLDNLDLASAAIPHLMKFGAEVASCEVTPSKLYIKATRPDLVAKLDPPPGAVMGQGHTFFVETIEAAVILQNSEIGIGRLSIQPAVFTKRCTNLAVFNDASFFKVHLGSKIGGGAGDVSGVWEFLSDETRAASDAVVWSQVNDLVAAAMDGSIFEKIVADLQAARNDAITKPIPEVMELAQKSLGFSQAEGVGILSELIKGGDLSRFGLHNAVTRFSQDLVDYDRATDLEQIGGKIIELKPNQWREMAVQVAA